MTKAADRRAEDRQSATLFLPVGGPRRATHKLLASLRKEACLLDERDEDRQLLRGGGLRGGLGGVCGGAGHEQGPRTPPRFYARRARLTSCVSLAQAFGS